MTAEALAEAERLAAIAAGTSTPALYWSTRLADVTPERVAWLWPAWVPRGMTTVLDGPPGAGKSTLTLDLAARVTTGRPMPGEDLATVPASDVVIMSAEDPLAQVIRPRLDAAGADCTRVHHLDGIPDIDDDGTPGVRPPSIPGDIDAIEALVTATGAVLVVVDVIMAYLHGSTDSYRDQDVRRALAPLAAMAERTGAAVILLRHPRKSGGTAMAAGGGSIAIGGAARSWLAAAPDPSDETGATRVLAPVRPSLAAAPPSRTYTLVADDPMGYARVEWTGTTATTADALYVSPPGDDERTERDEAADWLRSVLADGPVDGADLRTAAGREGLAWRTVQRARDVAGVETRREGSGRAHRSVWALVPLVPPPAVDDPPGTSEATTSDQGICPSETTHATHSRHVPVHGTSGTSGPDDGPPDRAGEGIDRSGRCSICGDPCPGRMTAHSTCLDEVGAP